MGYKRLKPRSMPNPQKQNHKERQKFVREVHILQKSQKIDLWYCDESGFQGDPSPRYVLAKKGSRPEIVNNFTHFKSNLIGAARQGDGMFVSLIVPFGNTYTFQLFLNELQKYIDRSKKNFLILDNATFHKTQSLKFGKVEPIYLPTYSPDLNPIEQLWLSMKTTFFSWFRSKDHDNLDKQLSKAACFYHNNPEIVKSICSGKQYSSKSMLDKLQKAAQ